VLTLQVSVDGVPVGGLAADELHVKVDGRDVTTTGLTAMPDGSYQVSLGASLAAGSHRLRVEVDTATASGEVEATIGCPGVARRRLRSGG
jgi:hypothetical protein